MLHISVNYLATYVSPKGETQRRFLRCKRMGIPKDDLLHFMHHPERIKPTLYPWIQAEGATDLELCVPASFAGSHKSIFLKTY